MIEFGAAFSFLSGLALFIVSIWVVMLYTPRHRIGLRYNQLIRWAIALAFLIAGLNTLYWQVFGQIATAAEWLTVAQQRAIGDWLDVLFKGGHAVAAYLHLYAAWLMLPEEEKPKWRVWQMPRYPDRRSCIRKMFDR